MAMTADIKMQIEAVKNPSKVVPLGLEKPIGDLGGRR